LPTLSLRASANLRFQRLPFQLLVSLSTSSFVPLQRFTCRAVGSTSGSRRAFKTRVEDRRKKAGEWQAARRPRGFCARRGPYPASPILDTTQIRRLIAFSSATASTLHLSRRRLNEGGTLQRFNDSTIVLVDSHLPHRCLAVPRLRDRSCPVAPLYLGCSRHARPLPFAATRQSGSDPAMSLVPVAPFKPSTFSKR